MPFVEADVFCLNEELCEMTTIQPTCPSLKPSFLPVAFLSHFSLAQTLINHRFVKSNDEIVCNLLPQHNKIIIVLALKVVRP